MSCFYPRQALKLSSLTRLGKAVIRFIKNGSAVGDPRLLTGLPCGQCVGCRLERSRQWAIRMMNEADLHSDNCFITLTFDEPHLQARDNPMSLNKREFQLFMKRLRKAFPNKLRYFMCGEYGDLFQRPHYHSILFGCDFSDKVLFKIKDGKRYYTSALLSQLWPFGFCVITDVTFDTCAYVARYIMKKVFGKKSFEHYGQRIPEYTTMSRRSGIGKAWLDKYLQDVYPRDKIFCRDKKIFCKPPKAYDSYYEIINPEDFSRIKQDRVISAALKADDNTPQRLHSKKVVKLSQIKVLNRNLE